MAPFLLEFLGEVERSEAVLLSWGMVDGWIAEEELRERAERFLERLPVPDDDLADGYAVIEEMVRLGLLFRWEEGGGYRYRSRLAETVRLLARLRQLFPKHLRQPGAWLTAPTLVSDFRLLLRARQYPRRDQAPAECVQLWAGGGAARLTRLQEAVLRILLGTDGGGAGFPLAGFQMRATTRILQSAGATSPAGTVVCAGTGSGKTLAFYLPALVRLAGMIEADADHWTRALALYPRNELLKDQFTETCRQIRRLRPAFQRAGKRPLCIGAYFGQTPYNAGAVERSTWGSPWEARPGGRVCPFLLCPGDGCSGNMLWADEDRQRGDERLVCEDCGGAVESDEIVLTRQRLIRQPPDILFTTTVMMNQRLTDTKVAHLFGVGAAAARKPALVLLDEAHTYSGSSGAQVAYLLRRWRHRSQAAPHFVGLSATLMEASEFFSQLTGLPRQEVMEIRPEDGELIDEGMEYLLALRGDPVSGANLLSATIQTAMLLRRTLDRRRGQPSEGVFGTKVFIFTDDLDVTNRLYFNLLDAEGLDHRGRPDRQRHPQGSLAALRAVTRPDEERRFSFGQSWRLPEGLGHTLDPQTHLQIDRVSSQDSGVDAGADLIVATAALEVGFNDPDVGVVLQHKAPRDAASFLQRKGRAGRGRKMRPLTVVVLSDFARDQLAYQGYDLLFDPELRPRELPLGNRHVLKMQAAHAALDCIAYHLPGQPGGHFWANASRPARDETDGERRHHVAIRQQRAAEWLGRVLDGGDELDALGEWLRRSLRLASDDEVRSLLWEAPRALMTSVLPTLHRRLLTQWRSGGLEGGEHHASYHPLPEFVTKTPFDELNLPEVAIHAAQGPAWREEDAGDDQAYSMTVARALREFAPGRISRRFGIEHGTSRHWLPLDPAGPAQQPVDVGMFCAAHEREDIGNFYFRGLDGQPALIRVLRPRALHVRADAPRDLIKDSSNAFPVWHSQVLAPPDPDAGVCVDLPASSAWTPVLEEIRFFTHRQYQPAQVRRFTAGSNASLNLAEGEVREVSAHFVLRGGDGVAEAVALGFHFEADALRVRIRVPDDWHLAGQSAFAEKMPALRCAWFRRRVAAEPAFGGLYNVFERGWLAEVSLAALAATALTDGLSPVEAWQRLRSEQAGLTLTSVLEVIFQAAPVEGEDDAARMEQQRLRELREALTDRETLAVLDRLVPALWAEPDADWIPWLRERYLATIGACLREAIQQMCPELDVQNLVVDTRPGLAENGGEPDGGPVTHIWISEDTPGGGGVVERLLTRLTEAPRRLLDLMTGMLGASDYEMAGNELKRFLGWVAAGTDPALASCLQFFRQADSLEAITARFRTVQSELRRRGLQVSHAVLAALSARVLKAGSSAQTDALIAGIMERWQNEETRLGIEIEARAFAYALSESDELDQALVAQALPFGAGQDRRSWRFNALGALLWPRGSQARNHALALRNPYAELPRAERFLVLDALGPAEKRVDFGAENWRSDAESALVEDGGVAIRALPAHFAAYRDALIALLVNALDTGSLLLYPRLRGVAQEDERLVARLELVAPGEIAPPPETGPEAAATARLIVKTAASARDEVRDLLESLFALELLAPGEEIWLVSPWITDLPLLDNRAGGYSGLDPGWPKRFLSLAELLAFALKTNDRTRLRIVTRPGDHTARFCERLRNLASLDGNADRLFIDGTRSELHTKGLVTTRFVLNGSMNFTHNGIAVLDEAVHLETDPARIAQFRLSLNDYYA